MYNLDGTFDFSVLHTDALKQEHYDITFQLHNMRSDLAQSFETIHDVPEMAWAQIRHLENEIARINAELDRRAGKPIKIATHEELHEMVRNIEEYGYSWIDPHEVNGGCQHYECGKCQEEYCTWCENDCPVCGTQWNDDF